MQENGIGGLTLPLQLFGENRAPDRHLSRSVFCNDSLAIDDSHDALLVEMPARSSGDRGQIGGPDLETCRDRPISLAGHSVAGSAVSQESAWPVGTRSPCSLQARVDTEKSASTNTRKLGRVVNCVTRESPGRQSPSASR